jgi:hypothetical protein
MRNFSTSFTSCREVNITTMSHVGYAINDAVGMKNFTKRVAEELVRAMSDNPDVKPAASVLREAESMIVLACDKDVPENFFFGEEFPYGNFMTPSELQVVIDLGRFIRTLLKDRLFAKAHKWAYVNMNEGFTVLVSHNY